MALPNMQDVRPLSPLTLARYEADAVALADACGRGGDAVRAWATGYWAVKSEQLTSFASVRLGTACSVASAHEVIAQVHGFASWTRFAEHMAALSDADSAVAQFERAADAIVTGDATSVEEAVRRHPALVHARSTRTHRATLLHYTAANGVENYRQTTPPNILTIAQHLLDAGAVVDAEAEMYGGGATTLGLATTSAHTRAVGVQLALADLLLERGARMDEQSVYGCLMNGCPEAAAHLAARGAHVSLIDAAGIGRLERVQGLFDAARSWSDVDWQAEVGCALMMAVWYGHADIVAFLLDRSFDPAWLVRDGDDSRTALHLAAYEGRVEIVELLLQRGAPVDSVDGKYGTTPLVWAMHAWHAESRADTARYAAVVRMLTEAGAQVQAE